MHFSHYLEQTVFRDQSPATAQLFDTKSNQLFEQSFEKSFVEIIVQIPCRAKTQDSLRESFRSSLNTNCHAQLNCDERNELSKPLPLAQHFENDLPVCIGSRGSHCVYKATEREQLAQVATVRRLSDI